MVRREEHLARAFVSRDAGPSAVSQRGILTSALSQHVNRRRWAAGSPTCAVRMDGARGGDSDGSLADGVGLVVSSGLGRPAGQPAVIRGCSGRLPVGPPAVEADVMWGHLPPLGTGGAAPGRPPPCHCRRNGAAAQPSELRPGGFTAL